MNSETTKVFFFFLSAISIHEVLPFTKKKKARQDVNKPIVMRQVNKETT